MPGEIEWDKKEKADKDGIDLPCDVVQSLTKLSQSNGIDINWI
jgi:LDH2 family malate/lactate/ureidoglycolate dehydrogenase